MNELWKLLDPLEKDECDFFTAKYYGKKQSAWKNFGSNFYYLTSKIVFNNHIDCVNDASNMRMFEATGSKSCLITDKKENLNLFFDPRKDIIIYKDIDDAVTKINFYLRKSNEKHLKRLTNNGYLKTRFNHLVKSRVKEIETYLIKYLL